MIIIAGTIDFDSSKRSTLDDAFETMRAATLQETGCHEYQCYVSRTAPGTAFFFEKWEDDAALAGHMHSPHMAEFQTAVATLQPNSLDIKAYEVEREVQLPR